MADPVSTTPVTPAPTTALNPGLQTSEGKLAVVATVLGVLGTIIPTLLTMLTDISAKFPTWGWVAPTVGVVSFIGTILTALGYMKQRTALKIASLG